jgi:mRNA interferase YafQ
MKDVHYTSKAKKDLKRYRHKEPLMKALFEVLQYLINDENVPTYYFPHPLHGDYNGCMECHVEDDFILI